MKFPLSMLLSVLILSAIECQGQQKINYNDGITQLPCDTWGKPDWSEFEAFVESTNPDDSRMKAVGARIREYDYNIERFGSDERTIFYYYEDEVAVRWFIEDISIPYEILISVRPYKEVIKTETTGCAIMFLPNFILKETDSEKIAVSIQRLDDPGQWGIEFMLKPVSIAEKTEIEGALAGCESLNCRLEVLLKNELYIDALTLLEKHALTANSDELKEKYWQTANQIRINLYTAR